MKIQEKQKKDPDDAFATTLAAAFTVAVVAALVVVGTYIWRFGSHGLSDTPDAWGAFGDYLGGVINPIVGLVTVFLVLLSVSIQRKELRSSVEELRATNEGTAKMSFEQTLFAWLANYQNLLSSIEAGDRTGRKALSWWYRKFASHVIFNDIREKVGTRVLAEHTSLQVLMSSASTTPGARTEVDRVFSTTLLEFNRHFNEQRSDLDALLRTLYRLIRWIDASDWSDRERWHYVALVRAQLSWIEMVYLLYNALTARGEKFAVLINKYALFDNLAWEADPMLEEIVNVYSSAKVVPPSPFGATKEWPLSPSAFSSFLAKKQLNLPDDA